jgi:hypothetical protein
VTVPTLTAVTPAAGLTKGGSVVRLVGTGFRTPPAPLALGYVGGAAPQTVSVQFGGTACLRADALSATLIACRPAPWAGDYTLALPLALTVRVANLDDAGVEILGEVAVLPAAYTVSRPGIAAEGSLQRAVRAILLSLRRGVLANTHLAMSRDYDGDLGTPARDVATLPAITLIGPTLTWMRDNARTAMPPAADPWDASLGWRAAAPPPRVDVRFDVRVAATGATHAFGLLQALVLHLRDVPVLTVDDQDYAFLVPFQPNATVVPTLNGADVYEIRTAIELKAVQLTDASDMLQIEAVGRTVWANDGLAALAAQAL